MGALATLLLLVFAAIPTEAGKNHQYEAGEHISLYANKVGPLHNPRYVSRLLAWDELARFWSGDDLAIEAVKKFNPRPAGFSQPSCSHAS